MKYFLGIVLGCVVVLTAYLVLQGEGYAWAQTLRVVSFQVISLMTTTGFVTADYDLWPSFPPPCASAPTYLEATRHRA